MDLVFTKKALEGGSMDICGANGRIYAIQKSSQYKGGRLVVLDTELNELSSVCNIGNARQIAVCGNTLAVSARETECGFLIFQKKHLGLFLTIRPLSLLQALPLQEIFCLSVAVNTG